MKAFIAANLRLESPPLLPEIRLYAAHAGSGLRRLAEGSPGAASPYWAYPWAGGVALARYILDHPDVVAGRRMLDLGAGGGLVAIAAAKAGAAVVTSVDIDPNAIAAIELNAAANGVVVSALCADILEGPPPAADIVCAGDLFYERALGARVTAFLDRCLAAGVDVLAGDPGRVGLPADRLRKLADYPVPDFGQSIGGTATSAVFALIGK